VLEILYQGGAVSFEPQLKKRGTPGNRMISWRNGGEGDLDEDKEESVPGKVKIPERSPEVVCWQLSLVKTSLREKCRGEKKE